MSKRLSGRLRVRSARLALFCAVASCLLGVLACGGRSMTDGSEQGSSGTSGSSDSAGHIGHSEGNTAGVAGAGLPSAGAGGAQDSCTNVSCPTVLCPVNTTPVPLPGEPGDCCVNVACQTVCTGACASCQPGSHPVMQLNACCPSCEPDPPTTPSCASGRMAYAGLRAQLLDKYSMGCRADQDCVALAPSNRCESECEYSAIVATQSDNWNRNLETEANAECMNCPLTKMGACGQPVPGVCVQNVCRLP